MSLMTNEKKQFISFKLDDEIYGIDIKNVQIIERWKESIRVPKASIYVQGVMNLRGDIIPIINIRKLFKLEETKVSEDTRIIIIKLEDSLIGIIVDSVQEVLDLKSEQIEGLQNLQTLNNHYISGVGKLPEDHRIMTLLNLKNIIEDAFRLKVTQETI